MRKQKQEQKPGRGDPAPTNGMNEKRRHDKKDLPTGWEWKTLGEACTVILGQSPESATYNTERNGLPFFQGKAEFGARYPTVVKWCSHPKKIARKDDILMSVRAPVGPTNLAPSECCIGRGLAAVRPSRDSDYCYMLHYLRSIEHRLSEMGTGTTFKAISGDVLRSIEIPLAPLPIQKLIVAEIEKQFSRLDEAVAGLKRIKANLKRYKASVLKAAVEGKLTEEWRKNNKDIEPAEKLLKRILAERKKKWEEKNPGKKYKEPIPPDTSNLPELPKGWVWATVEQLTIYNRPCAYGVLQPGPDLDDGIPLVRVGDISEGCIDISSLKKIAPKIANKYPRTCLQGGEVLITLVGAIGRTAVVPKSLAGANTARAVGVIPVSNAVNSRYIELWFRNPEKVAAMDLKSHEVARKTLNLEDVRIATVALASKDEQNEIVIEAERMLSVAEEIETEIETNLKRAERLRQAILKKAFSGTLVKLRRR